MTNDDYIVMTPYGSVVVTFDEDGPTAADGPSDAILFLRDKIDDEAGPHGIPLSLETIGPDELANLCARQSSGCVLLPPLEDFGHPQTVA